MLGEIYAQGLAAAGYTTKTDLNLGDQDAALATLIRAGKITQRLAESRSSTPEELRRLMGYGGMAAA